MREWLVGKLVAVFAWVTIQVAPKPPTPPEARFEVQVADKHDMTVELLFVPADVGEWHVVAIQQLKGHPPLLIDSAVGRTYVWPLGESCKVPRLVEMFKPAFHVTLKGMATGLMQHTTIGPVTCVTLAKRLVGVHNPGIVTARQMLALLWEKRDGFSRRSL